jgi:hypothetical protein
VTIRRFAAVFAATAVVVTGSTYTWLAGGEGRSAPLPPTPVLRATAGGGHGGMAMGVSLPDTGPPLAPGATHGLVQRLRQYPTLSLATPRQRAAASWLRAQVFAAASRFASANRAEAVGFDMRRARRGPGSQRVMWFHAENRRRHATRGAGLDPAHPDTLIYADLPGRPLRLVGVMISMPRGLRGPTPGGPITRWHHHLVCVSGSKRGLSPRPDGSCPRGAQLRIGSEMLHVWFTRDLRSAFAVHAPVHELCLARLLTPATCASGATFKGM